MAVPLNVDPELGQLIRTARQARGWTIDELSVELGRFGEEGGGKGYVLGRTQLDRIETGRRNLSAEEAWRFVEMFQEYDAWGLLVMARAIDPDSSDEFMQAITVEAERRRAAYRESGGNRRRSERLTTRQMMAASRVASREGAAASSPDQRKPTTAYFGVLPVEAAA